MSPGRAFAHSDWGMQQTSQWLYSLSEVSTSSTNHSSFLLRKKIRTLRCHKSHRKTILMYKTSIVPGSIPSIQQNKPNPKVICISWMRCVGHRLLIPATGKPRGRDCCIWKVSLVYIAGSGQQEQHRQNLFRTPHSRWYRAAAIASSATLVIRSTSWEMLTHSEPKFGRCLHSFLFP